MAHAYTPGLKVSACTKVRKERLLPLAGDVVVQVGAAVQADSVVARAQLPGNVEPVNVSNKLGIGAAEVPECMLKREGESVRKDEIIARTKGFFGLLKQECRAPMDGTLGNISKVTGQVMVQGPPIPVEVKAYIEGKVVEILPREGVVVESYATFVQGIFGVGGETDGKIELVVRSPEEELDVARVPQDAAGKILVGGSLVTYDALVAARQRGARAIVAGGFHDADLKRLLGYDLGVAITGNEQLGITLVVTEGFGSIRMADRTFKLLRDSNGRAASVNGATQIRAGVMRPEIIIPLALAERHAGVADPPEAGGVRVGDIVRIIRQPHFGKLGRVLALPAPLQKLQSESMARVLELEIDGEGRFTVARANIESIEEA